MEGPLLFDGSRTQVRAFLPRIDGSFYVYLLCRPDGQPFYVGKGLKQRVLQHEAEARQDHKVRESNPFKCNVIRKILRDGGEVRYRIDSCFDAMDQQACLEREAVLIGHFRRLHEGGCLTNLAGGIGTTAGAAPFSRERHAATLSGEPADNPQRAVLNRFLAGIGPVDSVPIKPVSQIARILTSTPHPLPRNPTVRCAYALVASASATGRPLVDGVVLPRRFVYQDVEAIIENGVSRDILKSRMADLIAADDALAEGYCVSGRHIDCITGLLGREMLVRRGLL